MEENLRRAQYLCLVGLFFSLPLNAHPLVSVLSLSDVFIFGLVAMTGFRLFQEGQLAIGKSSLIVLVAFATIAATRSLPLIIGDVAFAQTKYVLSGVMVVALHLVMVDAVKNRGYLRRISVIIIFLCIFINLVNIAQSYGIFSLPWPYARFGMSRSIGPIDLPVRRRGTAVFRVFGSYGLWSILAMGFMLPAAITKRGLTQTTAIAGTGIILFGNIAVLQSRSVWLGLGSLVVFFTVASSYNFDKYYSKLIRPVSILCLVLSPVLGLKIYRLLIGVSERTVESRLHQYYAAVDQIKQSPLTGVSYNTVLDSTGFALHNGFLEVATYGGILSLFALVLVYLYISLQYGRLISRREASAIDIGIYSVVIGTAVTSLFFPASTSYLFWIPLSLAAINFDLRAIGPKSPIDHKDNIKTV